MLPLAPGANGQPPSPPTDASSRVTPAVTAAYALASPAPRVLWKCAPSGMSPISGRTSATRSVDPAWRRGADGVGDREPVGAVVAAAVTMSSTRCGGVGPSNGQSHAVAMMTSTDAPLSWAMAMISAISAVDSAVDRPTLARLWPSAADTTYSIDCRPAAIARLAPLGLATRAENSMPGIEVRQLGGEFGGIGQRGHLRRGHERGRLHLPHAGGDDRLEQFELGGQRDRILDLQAVAQRDLADVDVCR